MREEAPLEMPPTKKRRVEDGNSEVTCRNSPDIEIDPTLENGEDKYGSEDSYGNYVTAEELERLKEFKVLDEVKSNDEDSNEEESDSSDGVPEEEIEKMLEEDLPEDFKGAPKLREKAYITRQKIVLEEKGVNHFEVLPLDWIMVRHISGMPIYMHRASRVCTLSKPYFLGMGNTRRHEIPISAIPCFAYRRALEEEEKQKEIDQRIAEQIRTGNWVASQDSKPDQDQNSQGSCDLEGVLETKNNGEIPEEQANKCPFSHGAMKLIKNTETVVNGHEESAVVTNGILVEESNEGSTIASTIDSGIEKSEESSVDKPEKVIIESFEESAVACPDETTIENPEQTGIEVLEESISPKSPELIQKHEELSIENSEESAFACPDETTMENPEQTAVEVLEESIVPKSFEIIQKPEELSIENSEKSIENNPEESTALEKPANSTEIPEGFIESPQGLTEQGPEEMAVNTPEEIPSNSEAGEASNETATNNEVPLNRQPVVLPGGIVMPPPRVETVNTSWKTQHLTAEQINDYCKRLFKFKIVNIMHFRRWADRRKYTKARKTLQYPTLPEGTKLITIPAQPAAPGDENSAGKANKRDWVMNMNGRSYLSVFHEYVRRALQKQPVYEFKQLENASTPYQATVFIGGMQYGVGHGSSKRQAKSAAARNSIHILIPEMKDELDAHAPNHAAPRDPNEPDFSFFDYVGIEDPRITEFCAATCEPSPHAILRTCLLRNFGAGDRHIQTEMKKLEFQKIELTMKVGKHSATVVSKNKKTAKQRASQAILQALHPHVRSWGSLLRLYGSRSVKSCKEKKLEEQQITLLQDQARHNEPNYAVLDKLRHEMRKLRERDDAVVPIGTLMLHEDLPTHSGSNLNNVDL